MLTKPTITGQIADFAANTKLSDIPESALQHAKKLLLDSVACSIASDFSDETPTYAAFAASVAGSGSSTVIGSGTPLSTIGATLLNAYQITAATVCDTYVPAHVHICPEIVPPALAVAERDGLTGEELLGAIVIGSEVAVRVSNGINYKVAGPMGWHMPGIVGPFGAAAAVGRLIGLTPSNAERVGNCRQSIRGNLGFVGNANGKVSPVARGRFGPNRGQPRPN